MTTYTGVIVKLKQNQIFVFGSNTQGRHGKGAALQARKFGAIYGQASGLQGQTWAIITKDLTKKVHPSISREKIREQIEELYKYAREHPELEFLIAYSTGPNLNGYTPEEMGEMFGGPPDNIVFETNFYKLVPHFIIPTSKPNIF